jgi:hypothetical protein
MARRSFSPINLRKRLYDFERWTADAVNHALRQHSVRRQRTMFLVVGIALAAICAYQVLYSLSRPNRMLLITPITLPTNILSDTTRSRADPRVIGVLIPRYPGAGDSLWIASSIHRRYFIGNRIRWLEIPMDSLKAFRRTHYYRPIR